MRQVTQEKIGSPVWTVRENALEADDLNEIIRVFERIEGWDLTVRSVDDYGGYDVRYKITTRNPYFRKMAAELMPEMQTYLDVGI